MSVNIGLLYVCLSFDCVGCDRT